MKSAFRTALTNEAALRQAGNVLATEANLAAAGRNETLIEVIRRLANRKGAVSGALGVAARSLKRGASPAAATREFLNAIERMDAEGIVRGQTERGRDAPAETGIAEAEAGRDAATGEPAPSRPRTLFQDGLRVELTGEELGVDVTDRDALRKAARARYDELIAGEGVENAELGRVKFSGKGRKKTLTGPPLTLRAVAGLNRIVSAGRRAGAPEPDRKGRKTVKAFHSMAADITIAGVPYRALFHVREDTSGKFHYDLYVDEAGASPVVPGVDPKVRVSDLEQAPKDNVAPGGDNINLRLIPLADAPPRFDPHRARPDRRLAVRERRRLDLPARERAPVARGHARPGLANVTKNGSKPIA